MASGRVLRDMRAVHVPEVQVPAFSLEERAACDLLRNLHLGPMFQAFFFSLLWVPWHREGGAFGVAKGGLGEPGRIEAILFAEQQLFVCIYFLSRRTPQRQN